MKYVKITVEFPIPIREEENVDYGDFEDSMQFWEANPSPIEISKEVNNIFESEHCGIAEYKTTVVTAEFLINERCSRKRSRARR